MIGRRILAALILLALAGCSEAQVLEIRNAVVVVPAGEVTAAYMTIANSGEAADRLTAVSSPVGRAELHRSFEDEGRMRMEPIDSIEIGPGEQIQLAPGGLHIMIFDVADVGSQGSIRLTLEFALAGSVDVDAEWRTYAEIAP